MYTPGYEVLAAGDVFESGTAAGWGGIVGGTGGLLTAGVSIRSDKSVQYRIETPSGFKAALMYGFEKSGYVGMEGADRKVVFQGVHQIMGSDLGAKWGENDVRGSKMVFIGKNLPKDIFISGLEQCLV